MEGQKQQAEVAEQPRPIKRVFLGPEPPRITAYGGVVPTRAEVQEELQARRDFGVGKN